MEFEVGKKYTGKNCEGEPILIQITRQPESDIYDYKVLKGDGDGLGLSFCNISDFAYALKPYEDLPRICYVLGGEDTPLKIDEEFKVTDRSVTYRIAEDGDFQYENKEMKSFAHSKTDTLCLLINGANQIIRSPQFSDDEKAFMRLLIKIGLPWIVRKNNWLYACENEPYICNSRINSTGKSESLPSELLNQIQNEIPFNAADYFESEGKDDG